jgi:hypothetical protein
VIDAASIERAQARLHVSIGVRSVSQPEITLANRRRRFAQKTGFGERR